MEFDKKMPFILSVKNLNNSSEECSQLINAKFFALDAESLNRTFKTTGFELDNFTHAEITIIKGDAFLKIGYDEEQGLLSGDSFQIGPYEFIYRTTFPKAEINNSQKAIQIATWSLITLSLTAQVFIALWLPKHIKSSQEFDRVVLLEKANNKIVQIRRSLNSAQKESLSSIRLTMLKDLNESIIKEAKKLNFYSHTYKKHELAELTQQIDKLAELTKKIKNNSKIDKTPHLKQAIIFAPVQNSQ